MPVAVPRILRFASFELTLWAGLFGAYLALRGVSIAQPGVACERVLDGRDVTATGNHYFLDSLVGAAVALTAVALVADIRRIYPPRKAEVIQLRPLREALEDARRAA